MLKINPKLRCARMFCTNIQNFFVNAKIRVSQISTHIIYGEIVLILYPNFFLLHRKVKAYFGLVIR